MLTPQRESDLVEIVQTHKLLQPVGGGSKPALSTLFEGATAVSLQKMAGILAYDPDEYTFTALAGTAVSDIISALETKGQYLPFDPLFVKAGATIGGTVAANTSGSGRFRYGGVRDFVLGVRFVDGQGRMVNGGGKVVKNAAGFDLPKFFTGSLGRFGIMTELTFKVFPRPQKFHTIICYFSNLNSALDATYRLANQPYELDALDMRQVGGDLKMWIRVGGLADSLSNRLSRLQMWLEKNTAVQHIEHLQNDTDLWQSFNEMAWVKDRLVKVPLAPKQVSTLLQHEEIETYHLTAAGNVAWVSVVDLEMLDKILRQLGLPGLVVRGEKRPFLGKQSWVPFAQRIKQALDPNGAFLEVTHAT